MNRWAAILILAILVLAFQNCSNAKFLQDITGLSGKGRGPAALVGLSSDGTALPPGGQPTGQPGDPAAVVPGPGVAGQNPSVAMSQCSGLASQAAGLPLILNGTSYQGQRGIFDVKADMLNLFEGNVGTFRILGLSAASQIASVTASTGNLTICGMDVGSISNFTGNILVVAGNVGNVSNLTGNLTVISGRVLGTVTNVTGNIIEN